MDVDALTRSALERVASAGSVKVSALGPASSRASVAESLRTEGLEVTKTVVRKPLGAQIALAVEEHEHVPLKSIASFVSGATATEARKVAEGLVAEGRLVKVVRGSAEVLVPKTASVLSREEIPRLRKTFDGIGKALAKVSKQRNTTLLRRDVLESLEEVFPPARRSERSSAAPDRDGDMLQKVLAALEATLDGALGLSFVPAVIHRLQPEMGVQGARASLLEAAARGLVELRPEGGLNRLTKEELEMCLPGPHGTLLSWARRVEGRPS